MTDHDHTDRGSTTPGHVPHPTSSQLPPPTPSKLPPPTPSHFPQPELPDRSGRTKRRSVWPIVAVVTVVGLGAIAAAVRAFDATRDGAAECDLERRTLEIAVQAFTAERGEPPRSIAQLDGYLRMPPSHYVVTNGQVYPASGSECVDEPELALVEEGGEAPGFGECVAIDDALVDFLLLGGEPGRFDAPTTVPCSEPHPAEVVLVDEHFFDDWAMPPDAFRLGRVAAPLCVEALEDYSGELYEDSAYDVMPWHDDRSLICLGFTIDPATGDPLASTASMSGHADLPDRGRVIGFDFTQPGDCLDVEAERIGAGASWARQAGCDEAHNAEVVANEAARFRGSDEAPVLTGATEVECATHLERYVGRPFEDRTVDFVTYAPSAETWTRGGRGLVCIAVHLNDRLTDLAPVKGSIRGDGMARPDQALRLATEGPVDQCYRLGDVYFRTQLWWVAPIGRPVDCADAHDGEVILHEPSYFGADVEPSETAMASALDRCAAELTVRTGGITDGASPRDVIAQPPVFLDWDAGDRSLTCIAFTWNETFDGILDTRGAMRHG